MRSLETDIQFNHENFRKLCKQLAKKDPAFREILKRHGYPPMWTRPEGFPTLIQIILEQQVSLASAKAAFKKLKQKVGTITPKKLLGLSDTEFRSCHFSRQKIIYARHLAELIISKVIKLKALQHWDENKIRATLKQAKGIGDWTADVYLLFALRRRDIFPVGDLAVVKSLHDIKQIPEQISREEMLLIAETWRPNRSIAAILLWHHYIRINNINI